MPTLDLPAVQAFVNDNISTFHTTRLEGLKKLKFSDLLKRKNPYLFRAKNIQTASELVTGLLDAFLSSSEEKHFGDFLEALAVFVATQTSGGAKSSTAGVDIELFRDDVRYLIAVKSGPNWGNSSQYKALQGYFKNAVKVLRQSKHTGAIQPVLGICYGKTAPQQNNDYWKLTGQAFWHFLSGSETLYAEIIEPIGYESALHNLNYETERIALYEKFTLQFKLEYTDADGHIDWDKLIAFNSGSGILDL
jgi:Type II restriction endonuclease EcoO109I